MLNEFPEEILPVIAEFLPVKNLRNVTQLSRKYLRVLTPLYRQRRYETSIVKYEEKLPDKLLPAGTIVDYDTLLNTNELQQQVQSNCVTLITLLPEDEEKKLELLLTLALLFRNTNVKYFEAWREELIGYGFPHSDRKFTQRLKNGPTYMKEHNMKRDWVIDDVGGWRISYGPGGLSFEFEDDDDGTHNDRELAEPAYVDHSVYLGPLPLDLEVQQDILSFMKEPPYENMENITLRWQTSSLAADGRFVKSMREAWDAGHVRVTVNMGRENWT